MVQVLKDEVKEAIRRAALEVFVAKGFAAATMAEIARAAGASTGNVYRYFEGKGALLEAAVPPEVARAITRLLRERVQAYAAPIEGAPGPSPHALASERLLAFTVAHRRETAFLLSRAAEGSRYEGFAAHTVELLVGLALPYVCPARPAKAGAARRAEVTRFVLTRIYENLVGTTARILAETADEATIRAAVDAYGRYHLAGLIALAGG